MLVGGGSVTSHKRQATSPAPSFSSTQVSSGLPDGWKLLEINKIFGSRCAPACYVCARMLATLSCLLLLSLSRPTVCDVRARSGRLCDPTDPRFDDSDRDNGFPGVDFAQTLEYLALCKFERKESDSIGRVTLLWLTVADMVESDLEDAAVDATLAAWETESARLRAEAVRAARAERS